MADEQRLTAMSVIATMRERFTSANEVPVERAHITRKEWAALLKDVRDFDELGFHGSGHHGGCHSCAVARAIIDALTALEQNHG